MKLKMLITVPGSVNGEVREYVTDEEYEFVSDDEVELGKLFLKEQYAAQVTSTKRRKQVSAP